MLKNVTIMIMNKRVVYEEVESCETCPYNRLAYCEKLRLLCLAIDYERDCPLPKLEDVEKFTHYITEDKKLECCGNCRHWKYWDYNNHLKADLGICQYEESNVLSVTCNSKPCTYYIGV